MLLFNNKNIYYELNHSLSPMGCNLTRCRRKPNNQPLEMTVALPLLKIKRISISKIASPQQEATQ